MTLATLKILSIKELLTHITAIKRIMDDLEQQDTDLYTGIDRAFLREIENRYSKLCKELDRAPKKRRVA